MSKQIAVTNPLAEYIQSVTLREPELLRQLREETSSRPNASMQISAEQGQFMGMLVRLMGARRAIEVGVFTGYSSLSVALSLPPDGKLVACDVNPDWTSVARQYWERAGVAHKIELRLGPAVESLDKLLSEGAAGSFDFAFIDADKSNYANYYERCLQLLRPGGLIAVDNVLWSGRVLDTGVNDKDTLAIRAFNKALHKDERIWLSLLPIGDGLTLACKRN